MTNYKDAKYQFPASATTSGTLADARISASSVSQHATSYDDNKLQSNVALLGFKTAVNGSLAKYNLQDQIIDEYTDATGVDASASTNESLTAGVYAGAGGHSGITNTYNTSGSDPRTDSLQSLTLHADTTEISVEAWGGRGGASNASWKKSSDGTMDNTQSTATGTEGGGFTARLKGTFAGFDGSETIKIAVGKAADYHSGTGHGANSGGGGASWVLLEHGSAIGQTRGVANSKTYTPLIVSGGGGGAGVRNGYAYNQSSSAWTHTAQADANIATSDGATRTGTTGLSDVGSYITGTDDGEGGTSMPAAKTNGGGGAGFLNNGNVSTAASDYGDAGAEGKHPFDGSTPFQGGDGVGDGGYGNCRGGYGGGGGGNLSGAGGGGGFSGGSSTGTWSSDGCNGIGGGSLFGSTTADAGGYNNTITVTENTNTVADDADYSPTTNGADGRVIITQTANATVLDLTLQSTDTTASTANPDYADMVMLIENASGTATLNTDIKGYISEDSGVTFTQGTLVDEGTWGTNKKIIAFHDLDISAQTGSAMCYKITTHNQSAGVKETKIHATSIGWR